MSEPKPIHEMGPTAGGALVSAGYYVVGPIGQLVLRRPDQAVKPGWRLATQADIDAAVELERLRATAPKSFSVSGIEPGEIPEIKIEY